MLRLNIIPKSLKKEIRLSLIYNIVKKSAAILLINLCIYGIIILIAQILMQIHFVKTINDTSLVLKSSQGYSGNLAKIKMQLDDVAAIQENAVEWSYFLEYMAKNINDNLSFNQIGIDKKKNTITFSGNAATRSSLLEFKGLLESTPQLSDINFPISNILKQTNIDFQISAKIDSYEFKKL